jgi:hypothetical protein
MGESVTPRFDQSQAPYIHATYVRSLDPSQDLQLQARHIHIPELHGKVTERL